MVPAPDAGANGGDSHLNEKGVRERERSASAIQDTPALQDLANLGEPDVPIMWEAPGLSKPKSWRTSFRSGKGVEQSARLTRQESKRLEWKQKFEETGKSQPGRGQDGAGILNKMFFWWINPLVGLAYVQPLELTNLWDMPADNLSGPLIERIDAAWKEQQEKRPGKAPSLVRTLARVFRLKLFVTGVMQVVQNTFMLLVPMLVQRLLTWKENKEFGQHAPIGTGVVLAVLLFLCGFLGQGLCQNHQILMMYVMGMDTRTALNAMVYRKSLRLSNKARQSTSTGECVTLMSNDAQRLPDAALFIHNLWTTPIFIVVAVFLLVTVVGVAATGGLVFLCMIIPLQGRIAMRQMRIQRGQMARTDARLKLVNEVLQGIKIVKYYAWELPFAERLEALRAVELEQIRKFAFTNAYSMVLLLGTPSVMVLITLVTFYLTSTDFSPSKVFTAVSLLLVIRFPLFMLPMTIASALQASVSLNRLQRFLLLDEISEGDRIWTNRDGSKSSGGGGIAVTGGKFLWAPRDETAAEAAIAADQKKAKGGKEAGKKSGWFGRGNKKGGAAAVADGAEESEKASKEKEEEDVVPWELHVDSLKVDNGELVAVVGAVGSGKSSLISAVLGDMTRVEGEVCVDGSVAYVAQSAWIVNASLRNNVLMGRELDAERYAAVLEACDLGADLAILPAGDDTEIGEKGINLSGGQKQRVSLARAAYANADVYLFDDPLSAVDAQVGRHIFEKCIVGLLSGKTRLLCANQLQFLSSCDRVVVLEEGRVAESGTFVDLVAKEGHLAALMDTFGHDDDEQEQDNQTSLSVSENDPEMEELLAEASQRAARPAAAGDEPSVTLPPVPPPSQAARSLKESAADEGTRDPTERSVRFDTSAAKGIRPRLRSMSNGTAKKAAAVRAAVTGASSGGGKEKRGSRLIKDEGKEHGKVSGAVYRTYFRDGSGGWALPIWLFVMVLLAQGVSNVFEYWVSIWTQATYADGKNGDPYMYTYIALGVVVIALYLIRGLSFAVQAVRASAHLHHHLLNGVMYAPMTFFDTTPIGRILNRFSKDMDAIDLLLPRNIPMFLLTLATLVGVMITISVVLPLFIVPMVPLMCIYYQVQGYYRPVSRDLQRLESISRSPIFAQFSETLAGVTTLRAYNLQKEFIHRNAQRLDDSNRSFYHLQVCNRWLQIRLEILGGLLILCAALLIVFGTVSAGVAGLVLTYTQQITGNLNWALRMGCETEARITAAERIKEYGDLEPEAAPINPDYRPPENWPEKGAIVLKNVCMRYREDLDLVLKDVSIEIKAGERVGIAGRTGSGKSSLMVVLFRIVEPCAGGLEIDGVDALRLGLRDLRRAISIIPQDPVMFCGTLRQNLDPFERYDDLTLWDALRAAHLHEFVQTLEGKLDAEIAEGGENLSVGQRQLVCMARAILRRNKILVLDEATASIDVDTDMLIQATIRREFDGCTVLTIAHRLNTIMDSDRILIMSNGRVAEFDSPSNLVMRRDSALMGFISETGGGSSRRLIGMASGSLSGAAFAASAAEDDGDGDILDADEAESAAFAGEEKEDRGGVSSNGTVVVHGHQNGNVE